jgi:hypothetical protein
MTPHRNILHNNDPDYQNIPLRTQAYADLEITVFQE